MFALTKKNAVIYLLATILFLFHAFADARIIKRGGRGTFSDSNANSFILVEDTNINDLGLMEGFVSLERYSFNSGDDALISTPSECVTNFGTQGDLDNAIQFGGFVPEPCYYQVYENDLRLEMEGFGRSLFSMASSAEVIWTLSQAGMTDIVLNGTVSDSAALLDVLMPPSLVPGEYNIGLEVVFHSGPDNSFFSSFDVHDLNVVDCENVTPTDLQCYHQAWGGASDTLSFGAAYSERLVVLPGSAPLSVSEPASIGILLLGLIGIRRRKQ